MSHLGVKGSQVQILSSRHGEKCRAPTGGKAAGQRREPVSSTRTPEWFTRYGHASLEAY